MMVWCDSLIDRKAAEVLRVLKRLLNGGFVLAVHEVISTSAEEVWKK